MNRATGDIQSTEPEKRARRVGCVGYLNAKPLIEGLMDQADPEVRLDVPSALLTDLQSGDVDIALCPVIDYYRSEQELAVVPVGCIASDGPTKTVRLFSREPIEQVTRIHADADSHTSVALLSVLMQELFGQRPEVIAFDALHDAASGGRLSEHAAMLLIGDKVVTNAPPTEAYPHQLDLGEAWKQLTGLPFVFAVWMARAGCDLDTLPAQLADQRARNAEQIESIAKRYGESHGWTFPLAHDYLQNVLSYTFGPREHEAIDTFARLAKRYGLIEQVYPLNMYTPSASRPV